MRLVQQTLTVCKNTLPNFITIHTLSFHLLLTNTSLVFVILNLAIWIPTLLIDWNNSTNSQICHSRHSVVVHSHFLIQIFITTATYMHNQQKDEETRCHAAIMVNILLTTAAPIIFLTGRGSASWETNFFGENSMKLEPRWLLQRVEGRYKYLLKIPSTLTLNFLSI